MTSPIQAIIWDLDGVIIDSAQEHLKAWRQLARETGVTFTEAQFWAIFGKRNDVFISEVWGPLAGEYIRELADRKEAYFREFVRGTAVPLPGAIELLSALHDADYAQALASSTPMASIQLISEVLGLRRYLSVLVSSETVPDGKPAPDVFLKAAEELEVEPEKCLVIEDAVAGVEAAHAGGMRCIAVAGDRDLPGLRKAEMVVEDLREVTVAGIRELADMQVR